MFIVLEESQDDSFAINSVLNFTYELEQSKKLDFLGVTVTRESNELMTSVYNLPTYDNPTLNNLSIEPLKYKVFTIKTILTLEPSVSVFIGFIDEDNLGYIGFRSG